MLLLLLCFTIKVRDNGKAYSPIHGHLNSNTALLLPSPLLAQCQLFMTSTSTLETQGKKIKMIKKKEKKRVGFVPTAPKKGKA